MLTFPSLSSLFLRPTTRSTAPLSSVGTLPSARPLDLVGREENTLARRSRSPSCMFWTERCERSLYPFYASKAVKSFDMSGYDQEEERRPQRTCKCLSVRRRPCVPPLSTLQLDRLSVAVPEHFLSHDDHLRSFRENPSGSRPPLPAFESRPGRKSHRRLLEMFVQRRLRVRSRRK
jgi:hypothetical protein